MSGVYYKYFDSNKNIIEEITVFETENQDKLKLLEKKILDLELKNNELNNEIANRKSETNKISKEKNEEQKTISKKIEKQKKVVVGSDLKKSIEKKEKNSQKKIIKNLVKDVEYISVDQKGNKFYLLANSGKSNIDNNDILDLINVRGKITSDLRDTIYIVSDFAQYNSINLNSKFYENVIINYQDKQINCKNFDINMDTNKAVAYNNVIITDPKSVMKAGIVEFDLKTKDININPSEINKEIKVITD
tara:strand:+ start:1619 stop:2362 length:744 start_codon:yes stop_codon:yes gene_type:complete